MNCNEAKHRLNHEGPWPEFIKAIENIVTEALLGMPMASSTLTIRKEYNYYLGEWEEIEPKRGPGIKAVIEAIFDKWGLYPEMDYEIFSLKQEDDKILHIVFTTELGNTTDIMVHVCEWYPK